MYSRPEERKPGRNCQPFGDQLRSVSMAHERNGFTLIELLVVVAIIALLVSILIPALNEAKAMAMRSVCATNIHGLLLGVNLYYGEHAEIPNHSTYHRTSTNYFALTIGFDADAMEKNTGDFTAIYPNYVDTPDVFYCPDGPYSADDPYGDNPPDGTMFCFWGSSHGIMGRYITYAYFGRALPDGLWQNPALDINGDVTEIPESLMEAGPDTVMITDWNWWNQALELYAATNHPAYTGGGAIMPDRDGLNSGRVDGSVVWVDESQTFPRYYKQGGIWWHRY